MRLPPVRCMHEWPLALFSALVIAGAGFFAVCLPADVAGALPGAADGLSPLAASLILGGGLVSIGHLGRPSRIPLALAGAGRSHLSNEALLLAATSALAIGSLAPLGAPLRTALAHLAGAASLLLLVAIGLVYYLPGRWPWRGPIVLTPLFLGLAMGATAMVAAGGGVMFAAPAILLLVADVAVTARFWRALPGSGPLPPMALPVHPRIFEYARGLRMVRLLLVDFSPAGLLVANLPAAASVCLAAGLFVDRFSFYGLSCAETTEAAVRQVERRIADLPA